MSGHHTPCHQQLYTSQRIHDTALARSLTHTHWHLTLILKWLKIVVKERRNYYDTPYCKNPIKIDPVYHSILMVLHLITETFYCTLVAHCFDTLCYIFLTWSMLETPWKKKTKQKNNNNNKKKHENVSYQDNIKLNSLYYLRPPTMQYVCKVSSQYSTQFKRYGHFHFFFFFFRI